MELLLAQVRDYDTYAGAGCFDSSVTAEAIKRTLQLIRNG
ncbi:GSU3529 family protein [Geomonas sp.]